MNGLERIGQLAGTLAPGGVMEWLEYAAVLALVLCAVVAAGQGIALACGRTRRRGGRQAPGPPPGRPVTVPVEYAPGVAGRDGEPLSDAEAEAFAGIAWPTENGTRRRTVTRKRRTVRRSRATQRTGRK